LKQIEQLKTVSKKETIILMLTKDSFLSTHFSIEKNLAIILARFLFEL